MDDKPSSTSATPAITMLTSTSTSIPTATLLPATATPTTEPLTGLTLWQVNIRSGPGSYFSQLGQIDPNQTVQITGMDPSSEWFAILYPSAPEGYGWVTAEYIQVAATTTIPVIGQPTLPNGTPAPQAQLAQKLNVRSGPGTHYDSLGILPSDATIWLMGRDPSGTWLWMDYPPAPGGRGWVMAGYVQTQGIQDLPMVDASGNPLEGTPSSLPALTEIPPTPVYSPAFQDGDSAGNPLASGIFSPLGIRTFSITNELSAPVGDPEDWIAFRPYSARTGAPTTLTISLVCEGNASIHVQLWQAGHQLDGWGDLSCGDLNHPILLSAGSDYIFQLNILPGSGFLFERYTITLRNAP
jgi:uncharacterized protein YraI